MYWCNEHVKHKQFSVQFGKWKFDVFMMNGNTFRGADASKLTGPLKNYIVMKITPKNKLFKFNV